MTQTVGVRVYEIRRALGPDPRHEMPTRAFAELLNAKGEALGVEISLDSSAITRIEKGERRLQLEEVPVVAAVDPLKRGAEWLAWGERQAVEMPDPAKDRKLTDEEKERARRAAVAAREERRRRTKKGRGRAG